MLLQTDVILFLPDGKMPAVAPMLPDKQYQLFLPIPVNIHYQYILHLPVRRGFPYVLRLISFRKSVTVSGFPHIRFHHPECPVFQNHLAAFIKELLFVPCNPMRQESSIPPQGENSSDAYHHCYSTCYHPFCMPDCLIRPRSTGSSSSRTAVPLHCHTHTPYRHSVPCRSSVSIRSLSSGCQSVP